MSAAGATTYSRCAAVQREVHQTVHHIANGKVLHVRPDCIDDSSDIVARNARQAAGCRPDADTFRPNSAPLA